jgi:hypothetical protein
MNDGGMNVSIAEASSGNHPGGSNTETANPDGSSCSLLLSIGIAKIMTFHDGMKTA